MKLLGIIGFLGLFTIFVGCTTTNYSNQVFDKNAIAEIKKWTLDFTYNNTETDSSNFSKTDQITISASLQLRDDLLFGLKSKNVAVSVNTISGSGKILINPVYDILQSQFRTLDITFYDVKGELIGRIKVVNGDGRAFNPGRDNNTFAEFCVEKITSLIIYNN